MTKLERVLMIGFMVVIIIMGLYIVMNSENKCPVVEPVIEKQVVTEIVYVQNTTCLTTKFVNMTDDVKPTTTMSISDFAPPTPLPTLYPAEIAAMAYPSKAIPI
jgi:hypothetical protein